MPPAGRSDTPPRSRPHRAPPPLTVDTAHAEGGAVLDELPGDVALVVWGALRDLMAWVESPEYLRPVLFAPGGEETRVDAIRRAGADEALWAPLLALAALADDPAGADEPRLVHAARSIARWAGERGHPGTQLAFVQACALMRPDDAALALEVGRLARDAGQLTRGESWFRHAIRLGRGRDWDSYIWGFVGLSVQYIRTGNWPAASALLNRAMKSAQRWKRRPLEGVVHHHLFHLRTEAGQIGEAYRHAREALAAYGPDHPNVPALANDVGRFWLHGGEFTRAGTILRAVLYVMTDSKELPVVAANLTRALAGEGERNAYEDARAIATALIREAVSRRRVADAHEALAHADLHMREWGRAEASAVNALRIAEEFRLAEVRLSAETLLAKAQARQIANRSEASPGLLGASRQADLLAHAFVRELSNASL